MALHVVVRADRAPWKDVEPKTAETAEFSPVFEDADALRAALDGQELSVLGRTWRVEVFTVAEISSRRYVQVALRGIVDHFVTLRLGPNTTSDRPVAALLAWLAHPAPPGHIVDVA